MIALTRSTTTPHLLRLQFLLYIKCTKAHTRSHPHKHLVPSIYSVWSITNDGARARWMRVVICFYAALTSLQGIRNTQKNTDVSYFDRLMAHRCTYIHIYKCIRFVCLVVVLMEEVIRCTGAHDVQLCWRLGWCVCLTCVFSKLTHSICMIDRIYFGLFYVDFTVKMHWW